MLVKMREELSPTVHLFKHLSNRSLAAIGKHVLLNSRGHRQDAN